ncbi:MAG: site-2 protease family protein [Tenericutes bacterium HGW-Tenericutes-4]|jgi:Zn-dependent protease|nr:MAG: site-2 protease family protein [Tenericutes bacterium HGW-Tenericutes-4]
MLNIFSNFEGAEVIIVFLAFFVAIIAAITLHEFAHAFVAHKQGDLTPKSYGRLTLNPMAHIDPIGMLMLLLVGFGWAKPVPVNPLKFKHYRRGFFLVSVAGIIVNIILFLLFTSLNILIVGGKIPLNIDTSLGLFIFYTIQFLITINLSLAIFNILPIAPLDGFNMLSAVSRFDSKFIKFMRENGQWVLLILLISGLLGRIIFAVYDFIAIPVTEFLTNLLL